MHECSSFFSSKETRTDAFSSSHAKFQQFYPLPISHEGSFFFGQSFKRLSADHLRCEHRRFYMTTSVGLASYILADLGPHGELLTKQTSFLVQPYAWLVRIALQNFTSLFHLPIGLQASMKRMYASNARPFSNHAPPSQLRETNWFGIKLRVSDQNGVSPLYIMLEIRHSGWEPSKWRMWSKVEQTVSATSGYNVYTHIQIFSPNLDEFWKRALFLACLQYCSTGIYEVGGVGVRSAPFHLSSELP